MPQTCDILIVGGGVIGTSIAYHLAARRVGRVVLLEKSYLAAGSSGKSGAIIRQHYSNRLTAAMGAVQSLRVFGAASPSNSADRPSSRRTGMAIIVNNRDRAGLETNMAMQAASWASTSTSSQWRNWPTSTRTPTWPTTRWRRSRRRPATSRPCRWWRRSLIAARRAEADVRLGVEVHSVLTEGGKVVGVETNEGRYSCRTLVLAAGPWAATCWRKQRR